MHDIRKLFIKRLICYKKRYLLKALIYVLLFLCINLVCVSACQFTNHIYRSPENYNRECYYSGNFTNPDSFFVNDITSSIDEKDYAIVYNMKTIVSDDTVRYTGYYYGNVSELGFVYNRLSMQALSHKDYQKTQKGVVLSDTFKEEQDFLLDGVSLPISSKVHFQISSFAEDNLSDMNIKKVEVVLIQDDNVEPNLVSSVVIHGNEGFVQTYSSRYHLYPGSELNSGALGSKTSISVLFQYAFLIPFCFVLIFWSSLIRISDLSSRKEMALFRAFGYSRKKTKRFYFFENAFLSIPAFLLNEALFLPVFYFAFHFESYMPLILALSSLVYFLLYSYVYSCSTIRKLDKKNIL